MTVGGEITLAELVRRGFDAHGVRRVFRHAWNNPACGFGEERGGIFFRTRIGPCDSTTVRHGL